MIPTPNSTGFLRSCLTFALVLGLTAASHAADVYLLPSAAGNGSGSNFANAMAATQLQTAITNLQAGETIHLGSGNYPQEDINITGSGTAGSPKRIIGSDTGTGLPLFVGTFLVDNFATSADYLFKFTGAASHWEIKNLRVREQGYVFDMPLSGETFTLRSNLTFENIAMDTIEDGIRIRNAEHVLVKDCTIIRHTKKAFRIGRYSRYVTFTNCHTDATGGDAGFPTRSIPNGFAGDSSGDGNPPLIYDLRFIDCTARNNRFQQSSGAYWNGDGFSTERGTYNVTFTRCESYDNHDGGFDNKADNVIYDNCIALRNKKGYRIWSNAWFINCVGAYNKKDGGTGASDGVEVGNQGSAIIDGSTFHNNDSAQLRLATGYSLVAYDTILSVDNVFSTGSMTGGTVTLIDSIQYKPGVGPDADPLYVAAAESWEDSPVDGFNSATYSPGKGYFGQGTASTSPTSPNNLDATIDPTSPRRVNLIWTDRSSNESGFIIERSPNNVNFSQIGVVGTNSMTFSDAGLPAATTYYYRVRATNSVGNSSASNTDSVSTPTLTVPTAPAGLTAEISLETPGQVVLIWTDRSNNEDAFLLERSTDNVNFTEIDSIVENLTTVNDLTAAPLTVYYYRVRATNAAGNSAYTSSAKITTPSVYIKDNADSGGITITGSWTAATTTDGFYGTNYLHDGDTGSGKSVTFTPTLAAGGSYTVYARWTDGSNRASNAPIDVTHTGGTTTVSVSQKSKGGAWNLIGTHSFNAGTAGNLKVRNDGANGHVIADAALFMSAPPVSPNAPTSLSATAVSENQIDLSWTDNSNIENSYVIEYSSDNVTFSRAGSVNANTTTFSCTNLAGGITYYFRVSANGGAGYSGYSNTASTFTQLTLIKDNADANGVTFTGSWTATALTSGYYGSNYHHDGNTGGSGGKSVRFTPLVPETGDYEVWVRWTAGSNRASNAPYDVVHAGGTTTFSRSQKYNNGTWMLLDTFTFNAGTAGSVLLRNDGADGYVIADAVRFIRVSP